MPPQTLCLNNLTRMQTTLSLLHSVRTYRKKNTEDTPRVNSSISSEVLIARKNIILGASYQLKNVFLGRETARRPSWLSARSAHVIDFQNKIIIIKKLQMALCWFLKSQFYFERITKWNYNRRATPSMDRWKRYKYTKLAELAEANVCVPKASLPIEGFPAAGLVVCSL